MMATTGRVLGSGREWRRPRAAAAAIGLGLVAWATGCATSGDEGNAPFVYQGDAAEVQLVSAVVGGKNVYIPSTVVVTAGSHPTLSIFNTASVPHGFAIEGLGVEVVLEPGKETRVELPKLTGGRIYRIHCQLHPAHRTATLVVLPGS